MKAYTALKMSDPYHINTNKEILDMIHAEIRSIVYGEYLGETLLTLPYESDIDNSSLAFFFNKLTEEGYNIIHHKKEKDFIIYWGKSTEKDVKGEVKIHNRDFLPWCSIGLFLSHYKIKIDAIFLCDTEYLFASNLINDIMNDIEDERITQELCYNCSLLDDFIDCLISFKGYSMLIDEEEKICRIKP